MKQKHKYGAKKTMVDGITFDSKKEAQRYEELKLMEKNGYIKDLKLQVGYELIPPIYWYVGRGTATDDQEHYCFYTPLNVSEYKLIQKAIYYVADFVYKEKKYLGICLIYRFII